MQIRSPFIRRWLLYGALATGVHLSAAWFFGVFVDGGVVTGLTRVGEWLTFPGVWLERHFGRDTLMIVPSFSATYDHHEIWFYVFSFLSNSALWGFTIAGAVLYGWRRFQGSYSQHKR